MLAVVATFGLCLVIVLGAYWAFVLIPEDKSAKLLRKRLRAEVVPDGASADGLTRRAAPLERAQGPRCAAGTLRPARRAAAPHGRTVRPPGHDRPRRAGDDLRASSSTFIVIRLLTGLNWAATVVAIGAGSVPYLLVRYAAVRRTRLFEDQFPQAIDLIASSLRAGHAFTSGVSMVSDEVADPTGAEFRLLYDQQNFGMPLPDALKAFAFRVPLLDARFFITAVLTQREAGGNLAEVLDNLAGLIRERSRVKRQVRVTSAHGRITGWVLSMMPPALFLVMMLIAPEHMNTFVNDPLGVRMILVALVLQVIGTLAIRRIVNVEF